MHDLAHEFREVDVRAMSERITPRALFDWIAYFRARANPNRNMLRDPDEIEKMAAMLYG